MTDAMERPAWLTVDDFGAVEEPFSLLASWLEEAARTDPINPEAMAVATVDADGLPNVRMLLLKGLDHRGLVFYTNTESQKGRELAANPKAAVVFYWKTLARQVRLRGPVVPVADAEADAYFATRPRPAQIGAWASAQSAPLESRTAFEKAVAHHAEKYALGVVPRPPYWTGYRLLPRVIEFWREQPFRLHERLEFRRDGLSERWRKVLLYP